MFMVKRINHKEAYSLNGACTNGAEGYFSRLRRTEATHGHISGPYLLCTRRKQRSARTTDAGFLAGGPRRIDDTGATTEPDRNRRDRVANDLRGLRAMTFLMW